MEHSAKAASLEKSSSRVVVQNIIDISKDDFLCPSIPGHAVDALSQSDSKILEAFTSQKLV